MKKYILYEVIPHLHDDEDYDLEEIARFSSKEEAEKYAKKLLLANVLIEEEEVDDEVHNYFI